MKYAEDKVAAPKVRVAAQLALSQVKLSCRRKFPNGTGNLIGANNTRKMKNLHWQIYNDKVYAAIHEWGGVITPDMAGALTVPLNPEAKKIRREYKSLRNAPDMFMIESKKGNALLVKKNAGGIKPMFALVDSVYIKPTHFMKIGMRAARGHIRRAM